MRTIRLGGVLLVLAVLTSGCRTPTQEERDNRRLVDAILTAITIKNARLVEDNARRLDRRHDAGQLTDEQYQGLRAVIQKARARDWAGAERAGYEFRKQHPFVREGQ